jgi:hypothetical protein
VPKKDVHLKSHLTLEQILDRPGQLMRQEAQGFAWVMFFLQAGQIVLPLRISAQEQRGRFAKGPWEMGMADFRARGASTCAPGFLAALDQTAIGGEVLHAGKALDAVDVVEQHEAKNLADTGDGVEQIQGMGIVRLGRLDHREFSIAEQFIIIGDERQIDRDVLVERSLVKAFGHTVAGGLVGDLLPDLEQVGLPRGMVHMGQEFGPFVPQVGATPEQVAGGAHLGWRDRGLGEQTTTEQDGDLLRIDLVIFRFATVDGFHRESMSQDEGHALFGAEVGKPIPGADACNGHHQTGTIGGHGLEQGVGSGFHVAGPQDFPVVAQNTDVHAAGMQVDAAVKAVLIGGESHEVSSFRGNLAFSQPQHTTAVG